MPKKHRIIVLCCQIILIWLAVVLFFLYFAVHITSPNEAYPSLVIGFLFLAWALILETVAYEKIPLKPINFSFQKPMDSKHTTGGDAYDKIPLKPIDFSEEKSNSAIVNVDSASFLKLNEPTPQAKRLHEALNNRGIPNELEFYDGHKHVDISIPWAKLNLEIDGKYHLTDPEHLFRDLERDSYSHLDGIDTIRIPNIYVERDLEEVANSIAEVCKKRRLC